MTSSPCRNCDNRHMPKDMCMRGCEKIAAIQQFQHTVHTPPYTCDDDSDTFPCRPESSVALAPGGFSQMKFLG